tara:strand:- start:1027 stop:1419 length:393 start_codon:yes stop_codon:yes gene_type:complete
MKGSTFFNKSALKQLGDDEKQLIEDVTPTVAGLSGAYAADKATRGTVVNPTWKKIARGKGVMNTLKWVGRGLRGFASATPISLAGWMLGEQIVKPQPKQGEGADFGPTKKWHTTARDATRTTNYPVIKNK